MAAEVTELESQLKEESERHQRLQQELETANGAVYVLQREVEQAQSALEEAQLRNKQTETTSAAPESSDVKHYRRQLKDVKRQLAEENERIALLKVEFDAEIRKNRAQVDETEQEYLRQIAKLKAALN